MLLASPKMSPEKLNTCCHMIFGSVLVKKPDNYYFLCILLWFSLCCFLQFSVVAFSK